jgi:hypothetical protein
VTAPRQIRPGDTYLITRRVARRQLLLTPSPVSKSIMGHCFGKAAELYGIDMHALQVLGNHYHAVLTDPLGLLPEFMAWVDRESAKAHNAHYDRAENFWSSEHYSAVRLHDAETVWDKLGYTFVNVVSAGLVRDFIDWPGVRSTPKDWLRGPTIVKRPGVYFSDRGKRWAKVELRFTVPPHFRDRPVEEVVADMNAEIDRRQRDIRAERRRKGRAFLGADRVLKTNPFTFPKTRHVKGKLNPTFAAGTAEGQRRAREERAHFLTAYREARFKWRHGLSCLFPFGTVWLARFAGVPCAGPETACVSMDTYDTG